MGRITAVLNLQRRARRNALGASRVMHVRRLQRARVEAAGDGADVRAALEAEPSDVLPVAGG